MTARPGQYFPLTNFTQEDAQKWLNDACNVWNEPDKDFEAMVRGQTDDTITVYGDAPVIRGKKAFVEFLRNRFSTYSEYELKKTVRMVTCNMIALELDITWAGECSGGKTTRTHGFELLTFARDGYVSKMEIVSNGWPDGLV